MGVVLLTRDLGLKGRAVATKPAALLHPEFLDRDLVQASAGADPHAFARLVLERACRIVPSVAIRTAHVLLYECDAADGELKELLEHGVANRQVSERNLPSEGIRLAVWSREAAVGPIGRATHILGQAKAAQRRGARWSNSSAAGTRLAFTSACYEIPHKRTQRIAILLEHRQAAFGEAEDQALDTFFLALYYGALRLMDVIDTPTLTGWYALLSCLTPAQLGVMRDVACSPRHDLAMTGERLGLSKRSVQNHLYQVMKNVEGQLPDAGPTDGYRSQMVDLAMAFQFLGYAGRGDREGASAAHDYPARDYPAMAQVADVPRLAAGT